MRVLQRVDVIHGRQVNGGASLCSGVSVHQLTESTSCQSPSNLQCCHRLCLLCSQYLSHRDVLGGVFVALVLHEDGVIFGPVLARFPWGVSSSKALRTDALERSYCKREPEVVHRMACWWQETYGTSARLHFTTKKKRFASIDDRIGITQKHDRNTAA